MIKQKEFKIESRPELEFRVGKITSIEMLTLQSQINFKSRIQTNEVFSFILEHLEVKIADVWTKVKEPNREIYMPIDLEEDMMALQELVVYFLNDILKPLFLKSNE